MKRLAVSSWLIAVSSLLSAQTVLTDTLQEVTVTENRHSHALKSTAPMHVIDRRDIVVMGVTDMADALHRLPGITLRDYGGAGGMKTVSVRGFGAKHTGVSYDGVMLSECQSGEIDLSRYSLDNVAHLSLTVGDNDDIFIPARNATTPATLNIQTLSFTPDDFRAHLTAQLKAASFGYVSPFLRYEQNYSNHFAISAMGEFIHADNNYPYTIQNVTETVSDHRHNNRMNSGHSELNFLWKMNTTSRLSGKLYYYDNDRQLPGQVRYYSNESNERLRNRNSFGQVLFQTHLKSGWSLKSILKQNWMEEVYLNGAYFGSSIRSAYWQRETMLSSCIMYVPTDYLAFDYSVDYAYNSLNTNTILVNHPWRHTILQSLTGKWSGKQLTVMGRLLYSIYLNGIDKGQSARDMRKLSPSLSLSYKPFTEQDLYLRASLKNIFRAPTFNESYYFHYGSSDLLAESTNQYNVGVTYQGHLSASTAIRMTIDAYYNHVKDMIVAIPYNMFVWTCVNIGKVDVWGCDATIQGLYNLGGGHKLTAMGNLTLQSVENKTNQESPNYGKQIAYYPKYTSGASLSYENPFVNLGIHFVAVASRWATNEHIESTKINGYQESGVTLWRNFTIGAHHFSLRADLKNIFDKQYEIVRLYPMPGRSFQVSLNYKY